MMKRLSILQSKKPKNKIESSDFTEMNREGFVLPPETSQSNASYHRSCKTLPLEAFIQAYCNNDLSGLIITGDAAPDQLKFAWNEILFDYAGLFKTEQSEYLLDMSWEIGRLEHHVMYVQYAVFYLKLRYNDDFANELRGMGYIVPQFEDKSYQKALDMITTLATNKVFELNNLQDEYKRLKKTASGKNQSEDEFVQTVAMLSKYQGYYIDTLITTVYRFVMTFNNYLTEMSIRKKQLN